VLAKLDELFSDMEAGEKALERAVLLVKRQVFVAIWSIDCPAPG
jgi:hypothetical protein